MRRWREVIGGGRARLLGFLIRLVALWKNVKRDEHEGGEFVKTC